MPEQQPFRSPAFPDPVRDLPQTGSLRTLLDLSPDSIFAIDGKGIVRAANANLCRLLGYGEDELIGRGSSLFEQTTPTYQRKDGSTIDVEVRARRAAPGGLTLVFVAPAPPPQQSLRESERRLRDVLQMAQLNAVVLDRDARIVFCNRFLLRTTGYASEEVLGQDWFELFVPVPRREEMRNSYANWVEQGNMPPHLEHELLTRSGGLRQVAWDNTLLQAPQGGVAGAAFIGRDVTDQRRLEEQIRQAQRLETVGRLAGGIAHDFNNLLTVINGYADTALSDLSSFDPLYGMLEEIRRAGDRAARLTRQLLAFSRRQILEMKELNLNRVIEETAPMLRRLIGEDVELTVELTVADATIQADEGQLQQVILNLAVNSRDAMPDGGMLTIRTSQLDVAEENGNLAAGRYVVLAVSDNGCGMTDEVRSHVFEPFFTTKPVGKGTGLGLATVYGIVKQSGGHIWFEAAPGEGTTFYLAFPVFARAVRVDEESALARLAGRQILIVEDQREVRLFTRMALERAGYRVIEAAHGGEALNLVRDMAARVDLVISDVVMPDMGGFRLAEQVNAARPEVPFLFVTGYPDVPDAPEGKPVHLLQKPFTGQELLQKVQEMLQPR